MAAGSVAAGGLYMQSEFSQLKERKLQELGVDVPGDRSCNGAGSSTHTGGGGTGDSTSPTT